MPSDHTLPKREGRTSYFLITQGNITLKWHEFWFEKSIGSFPYKFKATKNCTELTKYTISFLLQIISIDPNLVCQHGLIKIIGDWDLDDSRDQFLGYEPFTPRSLFPILRRVLRGLFDSWWATNQYFQLSPLHRFIVPYSQRLYHLLSKGICKGRGYCTISSPSYYS